MLTPEQIEGFRIAAGRLIDPVNTYLLRDIARRVREAGELTSTAAYEAWRAEWMGKGRREMETELAQLLGTSRKEARKLLRTAARYGYDTTLSKFPGHLIAFDDNTVIQQIVSAAVTLAGDELKNLTQTTAIMMMDPHGKYQTLPEAYQACTDYAFQQVFTGATDYNTAIRQACDGISKHGVSVAYASGVHTSIEAAVRRNLMGGLGLMVEQISQENHDALGCNGWEISAHANSAPDHEPFQGHQYSDEAYEKLNNSLVRRIGTLNCGHVASPIILGVHSPQYTAAELEKFRQDNETGVTFDGKHYTGYEATQMQRKLERAIRTQKRRVLLAGPEDMEARRSRLTILDQEYRRFSKGVGLRTEDERLYVSGFGPKQMRAAKSAAASSIVPGGQMGTDVLKEYLQNASPGQGSIAYDADYRADKHKDEINIANWLHDHLGGDIRLLNESTVQCQKMPDYLWSGKLWDLKTVTTEKAANTAIKRGLEQIKTNPGGVILNYGEYDISLEELQKVIDKRMQWLSDGGKADVLVIKNGKMVKALRYKK